METERALRHADNKVVVILALVFGALVFLIGVASNDVPSEIPMVQSSFDVAPAVVTLPTPPENTDAKTTQLAHIAPAKTATAKAATSKKDYTWYADEAARGERPDSQH